MSSETGLPQLQTRPKLSPQQQGLAIGGATFASVVFVWFMTYHAIPGVPEFSAGFLGTAVVLGVLLVVLMATGGLFSGLAYTTVTGESAPAPNLSRYERPPLLWLVLLYVLSGGCIYLLGWATETTGGTLRSPFASSLVVVLALTPIIAKSAWTIVAMYMMTVISVWVFHEPTLDFEETTLPDWVLALSLFYSATVPLVIEILRRFSAHRKTRPSRAKRNGNEL